mmetsp:Transcript_51386/g.57383  ORF Transcript_51386/g.57383 Transcript_51386/m.57383 type:complete len:145 (-) Transcript_51386:312-746(-)
MGKQKKKSIKKKKNKKSTRSSASASASVSESDSPHDDGFKSMKCRNWNSWFERPIPMIGDITPREASMTVSGREKLDELFNVMYSMTLRGREGAEMRGEPFLNLNIPTRYAKWKLGIGPGNVLDFAEEEEIFNFMNTVDTSTPG